MILVELLMDRHVHEDAFWLAVSIELGQCILVRPAAVNGGQAIKRLNLLYAREELVFESTCQL